MKDEMEYDFQVTEEDLELAFLALATFVCSRCRKPLDRTVPRPSYGRSWDARNDKHICCNTAHCPFCGKPSTARCRHLVTRREYGKWLLRGVFRKWDGVPIQPFAACHGIPETRTIDFDDEQKQEAFGSAFDWIDRVYGEGFTVKSDAEIPLAPIIGPEGVGTEHRMETNAAGRFNHYHFSRNPESVRDRTRQMIIDLNEGAKRMKSHVPAATRFLLHQLTPADDERGISALQFSPDGRLLLIGLPGKGQLWDVETGRLVHSLAVPQSNTNRRDITASFSPDGRRVSVTPSTEWPGYSNPSGHKWLDETSVFDVATGRQIGKVEAINLPTVRTGIVTEALLAGGSVIARARGRFIHLAPIDKAGQQVLGGKRPVRLPHRTVLRHCAFSPDGRTLATIQSDHGNYLKLACHVLLWRL
ncbi:MAG: WD40 repeat domain-containing protein [Capsulimonadales bacterium]|nr:WD40 repeat domain-containing protein [Capsulimonadales bacterium]